MRCYEVGHVALHCDSNNGGGVKMISGGVGSRMESGLCDGLG